MSEPAVETPEPFETPEPSEPEPDEDEQEEEQEPETPAAPEPEAEPEDAEPEDVPEGRCEAETSAGGTRYRCSLEAGHDDEHAFQSLDSNDDGDPDAANLEAFQKSQKKVMGYVERYVKVLREEMGEEFEALTECPLCPEWTPGFFFPGQVALMDDSQRIAVRLAIGDAELPSYQEDTHRHVCETCGGWGRVLTGSKRAQQDVLDCLDCAGKGYRSDQQARQAQQRKPEGEILSGPWPSGPEQSPEPEPEPDTDPWGTPPGAPYYGVLLNLRPAGWEAEVEQFKAANRIG